MIRVIRFPSYQITVASPNLCPKTIRIDEGPEIEVNPALINTATIPDFSEGSVDIHNIAYWLHRSSHWEGADPILSTATIALPWE